MYKCSLTNCIFSCVHQSAGQCVLKKQQRLLNTVELQDVLQGLLCIVAINRFTPLSNYVQQHQTLLLLRPPHIIFCDMWTTFSNAFLKYQAFLTGKVGFFPLTLSQTIPPPPPQRTYFPQQCEEFDELAFMLSLPERCMEWIVRRSESIT